MARQLTQNHLLKILSFPPLHCSEQPLSHKSDNQICMFQFLDSILFNFDLSRYLHTNLYLTQLYSKSRYLECSYLAFFLFKIVLVIFGLFNFHIYIGIHLLILMHIQNLLEIQLGLYSFIVKFLEILIHEHSITLIYFFNIALIIILQLSRQRSCNFFFFRFIPSIEFLKYL